MRNVEVKAKVKDLTTFRQLAAKISGNEEESLSQRDTFFKVPSGRLKLRYLTHKESELIFYKRSDQEGPKLSEYEKTDVSNPEDLQKTLEMALGVRGEVIKTRYLYMIDQTRVHCDQVKGLGEFMELEVCLKEDQTPQDGEKIAHELMEKLGVRKDDLIIGAYIDLIEAKSGLVK